MPKKIQKAISAKDGVIAASKYFTEFNSGYTKGFSVEEIETDASFWTITLGFFGVPPKSYKTFRVNKQSGEVISMKIRSA